MPTSTYVGIANVTLGSSASSVTFSSISQAYRDLILVYSGSKSAAGNIQVNFNGDSSNLSVVYAYGTGSSTGSGSFSTGRVADQNTGQANFILQVMDYTATDKHKTYLSRNNDSAYELGMFAGRWASTSAVTSVYVFPASGTFAAGSTFALYGIAS